MPQNDFFGLKDGQALGCRNCRFVFSMVSSHATQAPFSPIRAEVDVDNADGVLAAGLYAIVHLKAPRNYSVFALASGDLRQEWAGARWVIRLQHLDLAADQGGGVEGRDGLPQGDQLILNPPIAPPNRARRLGPGSRAGVVMPESIWTRPIVPSFRKLWSEGHNA